MGSDFAVFGGVDFGSLMIDVVFEFSYGLSGILVFAMVGCTSKDGVLIYVYGYFDLLIYMLGIVV